MRVIGIVGSEEAKFTEETSFSAREIIREIIRPFDKVVSGGCHLGGIDKWAIEVALEEGKKVEEFLPKAHKWEGGYKQRNLQIVDASDYVVCITIREYPDSYSGMKFKYCYHCKTDNHVKSGGCWTMIKAKEAGKEWELIII